MRRRTEEDRKLHNIEEDLHQHCLGLLQDTKSMIIAPLPWYLQHCSMCAQQKSGQTPLPLFLGRCFAQGVYMSTPKFTVQVRIICVHLLTKRLVWEQGKSTTTHQHVNAMQELATVQCKAMQVLAERN